MAEFNWSVVGFPSREDVLSWSAEVVARNLMSYLRCSSEVVEPFVREDYDGVELLALTEDSLGELGSFTGGVRNKLIRLIQHYASNSSLSSQSKPKLQPVRSVAPLGKRVPNSALVFVAERPDAVGINSMASNVTTCDQVCDPGVTYDRIFKAKPAGCGKDEEILYGKRYLRRFHRTQNLVHNLNVRRVRSWFGETAEGKRGREVVTGIYAGRVEKAIAIKAYISSRVHELQPLQFQERGTTISFNWKVEDIYSHWFSNHVKRNKSLKPSASVTSSHVQAGSDSVSLDSAGNTDLEAESLRREEEEFLSNSRSEDVNVILFAVSSPVSSDDIVNREYEMTEDPPRTSNCKQMHFRPFAVGVPLRLIRTDPYRAWSVRIITLFPQDAELLGFYVPAGVQISSTLMQVKNLREEEVIELPQVFMSLEHKQPRDLNPELYGSQSTHGSNTETQPNIVCNRSPLPVPSGNELMEIDNVICEKEDSEDLADADDDGSEDEYRHDAEVLESIIRKDELQKEVCRKNTKTLNWKIPPRPSSDTLPVPNIQASTPDSSVDTSEFRPTKSTEELLQVTRKVETDMTEYGYELEEPATKRSRNSKTCSRGFTVEKENIDPQARDVPKDLRAFIGVGAKKEEVKKSTALKSILKKSGNSSAPAPEIKTPPVPGVFYMLSELSKKTIAASVMGPDEFKNSTVLASLGKWIAKENRLAKAEGRTPPFSGHQIMEPTELLDLVVKWALQTKVQIGGNLKMCGSLLVLNKSNILPL